MVPFIERVFLKKKLPRKILLFASMGLLGTAFICQFSPFDPMATKWNFGDLLTLGCALAGALQIIVIGEVAHRIQSSFVYNLYQSLWALLVALIAAPLLEPLVFREFSPKSLFGLLFVALGSTLVAFMLQVKAQKVLSSSVASLLFLLESPFAAIFAAIFLGEHLSAVQWTGAFLISLSALGAVRTSR
jgi:drug/metabolite transporter (DMT)-like permease